MIVILSSLNGRDRLRDMLAALTHVRLPAGTTIHAVDNGSEDGTPNLLKDFRNKLPLVLYSQPIRGKNHCLNLVLDQVRNNLEPDELIVFTDDDTLPSPDWLEAFQNAADAHPNTEVFAGRILPSWPDGEPDHLDPIREHFGILFSLTSSGEGPVTCGMAWGPNMVVRARVFQSGYHFDTRFGPNGTNTFPMGSETELMERLDLAGHRAWFVEDACVRHKIRASQLEEASVLQRAYRHGYGAGWRTQRGGRIQRLAYCQWIAFRGMVANRLRMVFSPKSKLLRHGFHHTWARGFASGSMIEYRTARQSSFYVSEDSAAAETVSMELSR